MSSPPSLQRLSLRQFADRFRGEMIPLGSRFQYFCAAVSLTDEDLREYLDEPVAALPPSIAALLPDIQILLVPYLELKSGPARKPPREKDTQEAVVATEKPVDDTLSLFAGSHVSSGGAVLAFAVKEAEVADYHYRFYRSIAEILAGRGPSAIPPGYYDLLAAELAASAHGEVDEQSWRLKLELDDAEKSNRKSRKFREYARRSYVDTMTLYLHGICCDIDVETGPRQLPSHLLRKRLRFLRDTFPPPEGYSVLPEDETRNGG